MREKIRTTRMMAFLLALAMVLCVVYLDGKRNQASAEEEQKTGYYSAYVPELIEDHETWTAKQVTFNGIKWYIIEDNSTAKNKGTLTLLTVDSLGISNFGSNDNYANSSVNQWLSDYYRDHFGEVDTAVNSVILSDISPDFSSKLYLLSIEECNNVSNHICRVGQTFSPGFKYFWWLRSPYLSEYEDRVAAIAETANFLSVKVQVTELDIRPALQLNLEKVAFSPETNTFSLFVPVSEVALDKTEKQKVKVDDKVSFTASISPGEASYKTVKWHVDKKNVKLYSDEACTTEVGTGETTALTVYAKGVKIGDDTITVTSSTDSNMSVSCDITVEKRYSWEWVNGKWYEKDGFQIYEPEGSWQKDSKGWRYGDTSGWYAKNRWMKVDGKWYFFGKDQYMETDTYRQGYYVGADGVWDNTAKVPGWKKDSKGWKYKLSGDEYLTGWKKIDGYWYYFKADGYAAQNEFVKGYWFNDNCTQTDTKVYSWHKDKKGWWYGINGGWYAKDKSFIIDGKEYSFDKNGYCVNP